MTNQFVLVGKIAAILDKGIKISVTVLKDHQDGHPYRNVTIPIKLKGNVAQRTTEYCHKGDTVGVKGYFDVNEKGLPVIIGDQVSFLSSGGDTNAA